MISYMDTNVFLARFKPDDPYHSSCQKIVRELGKEGLRGCTSSLAILEVASVTSRSIETRSGSLHELGVQDRGRVISALIKRLMRLNLVFVDPLDDVQLLSEGKSVRMPALLHGALNLTYNVGLRTLDCMHIASLICARRLLDEEIRFFVTGDADFLQRKKRLREITGSSFVDPDEFVTLIGL